MINDDSDVIKREELSYFGVYASLAGISPQSKPWSCPDSGRRGYMRSAVPTPGLERQNTDGIQDSTCV